MTTNAVGAAICLKNRVADHAAITAIHTSLAATVARTCTKLTSPFSACLLRAAAQGQFGEALCSMVAAVFAGDIGAAVAVAHSVGQSSGWDMLCGVQVTLRSVAPAAAAPIMTSTVIERQSPGMGQNSAAGRCMSAAIRSCLSGSWGIWRRSRGG